MDNLRNAIDYHWHKKETMITASDADIRLRVGLAILAGVDDPESDFFALRGTPHIVERIFKLATQERRLMPHVKISKSTNDMEMKGTLLGPNNELSPSEEESFSFLSDLTEDGSGPIMHFSIQGSLQGGTPVLFPTPTGIKVSMMPFILGASFDECKLPQYLQPYWKIIKKCAIKEVWKGRAKLAHPFWKRTSALGKVCYLTVLEETLQEGETQFHPGLWTHCMGKVESQTTGKKETISGGGGMNYRFRSLPRETGAQIDVEEEDEEAEKYTFIFRPWKSKRRRMTRHMIYPQTRMVLDGGVYMTTNVDDSVTAFDCKLDPNIHGDEPIGRLGCVEHLRPFLPQPTPLRYHRLYWMTDRTPFECVPATETVYRQFFSLVTGDVGLWFEDESTPNPLGVRPDPKVTRVVKGSRFDNEFQAFRSYPWVGRRLLDYLNKNVGNRISRFATRLCGRGRND